MPEDRLAMQRGNKGRGRSDVQYREVAHILRNLENGKEVLKLTGAQMAMRSPDPTSSHVQPVHVVHSHLRHCITGQAVSLMRSLPLEPESSRMIMLCVDLLYAYAFPPSRHQHHSRCCAIAVGDEIKPD